jgi:hypothetical protein
MVQHKVQRMRVTASTSTASIVDVLNPSVVAVRRGVPLLGHHVGAALIQHLPAAALQPPAHSSKVPAYKTLVINTLCTRHPPPPALTTVSPGKNVFPCLVFAPIAKVPHT